MQLCFAQGEFFEFPPLQKPESHHFYYGLKWFYGYNDGLARSPDTDPGLYADQLYWKEFQALHASSQGATPWFIQSITNKQFKGMFLDDSNGYRKWNNLLRTLGTLYEQYPKSVTIRRERVTAQWTSFRQYVKSTWERLFKDLKLTLANANDLLKVLKAQVSRLGELIECITCISIHAITRALNASADLLSILKAVKGHKLTINHCKQIIRVESTFDVRRHRSRKNISEALEVVYNRQGEQMEEAVRAQQAGRHQRRNVRKRLVPRLNDNGKQPNLSICRVHSALWYLVSTRWAVLWSSFGAQHMPRKDASWM